MNRILLARAWLLVLLGAPAIAPAAEIPATPAPAELVEATPFSLDEALVLPSGEAVSSGLVVVVRAEPALTELRQVAMPVLQCGTRVAAPASRGGGGVLVALILGEADPGSEPLFFGEPALASAVDAEAAGRRLAEASAAGIRAEGPEAFTRALARGADPLRVARFADLSPFLTALRCRVEPEALAAAGTPCGDAP